MTDWVFMNNEEEARDKEVSDSDLEVDSWPLTEIGNVQVVEICLDKKWLIWFRPLRGEPCNG